RGEDRNGAAHALAEQVYRPARINRAQQAGRGHRIGGERRAAGPALAQRRAAKAALVVGIGGDAMPGPEGGRYREAIAVIVEAMQGEDDRLDAAARQPFAQWQAGPVGGDERAVREARLRR